ncbi:MAG: L,D-transpeptidase [Gammaproteobacteria bacterium]|nr:L,D-transpeptidase [Gammaproteobacteria bacterium]
MRDDGAAQSARSSNIKAVIDLSDQEMKVYVDGDLEYTWKVSSGRGGYLTPNGTFKPQWLSRMHYSRKYDDAPMPYSVFFHGGYAVHGTTSISRLGRPASHGCVRLHPDNAKTFFNLIKQNGKAKSTIQIVGDAPVPKVAKTVRKSDGTLNHRPVYEVRSAAERNANKPATNTGCRGCDSMAKFGTIPSVH